MLKSNHAYNLLKENKCRDIVGDDSRPDIRARSVWREGQNAYFDICVTNTNSATQKNVSIEKVLKKHELRKKRAMLKRTMLKSNHAYNLLKENKCRD